MTHQPLHIDGRLVTVTNARRFVQARRPHATAERETERLGFRRFHRAVVRDRMPGAPGWVNATGKTAGEAWLRAARQMVEYDAKVVAQKQALDDVVTKMRAAANGGGATWLRDLEIAALRYAAERLIQSDKVYGDEKRRCAAALLEMAAEIVK